MRVLHSLRLRPHAKVSVAHLGSDPLYLTEIYLYHACSRHDRRTADSMSVTVGKSQRRATVGSVISHLDRPPVQGAVAAVGSWLSGGGGGASLGFELFGGGRPLFPRKAASH